MMQMFSYKKSTDSAQNDIIDGVITLAQERYDNKAGDDYAERNKKLIAAFAKKSLEGTRYAVDEKEENPDTILEVIKNPQVRNITAFRDNFNAILAQVITAVVPMVSNDVFSRFIAEVHQVGYGDTARFVIESNDLFKVSMKGEGVRKGVDQPMYDNEITVNAQPETIDAHIDWYPFAAGVFDMGNFALKIGRSYMAWIFLRAVNGMLSATTAFGGSYTINGVDVASWADLRDKVSAANGQMSVIAIGTRAALANCSLQGNYQTQIGEEMNKVGYLDQYLSTPLIALDNVLIPGTVNTTAKLALSDHLIYMIPVGGDKPVKIVFEGEQATVNFDPEHSSDKRYGISVELRVGVAAVCGRKYGTIVLA